MRKMQGYDDAIETFYCHHAQGQDVEFDALSQEQKNTIAEGVVLLTKIYEGDKVPNCFGWALGDTSFVAPGNMYLWGQEVNFAQDAGADNVNVLLWGWKGKNPGDNKADENTWTVNHASVKLSHQALIQRLSTLGFVCTEQELTENGVPDPCWCSAAGCGYGIMVHPRTWYQNGEFGQLLRGAVL